MQDIEEASELYKEFKEDSLFLWSKSKKSHYKLANEKMKKDMLENKKFDCLFLITTTVFENGNNIVDSDLHHMIIQLNDITSIQQAIGRKRLTSDDDYLCLAVHNLGNRQLNGLLQRNKKQIKATVILLE